MDSFVVPTQGQLSSLEQSMTWHLGQDVITSFIRKKRTEFLVHVPTLSVVQRINRTWRQINFDLNKAHCVKWGNEALLGKSYSQCNSCCSIVVSLDAKFKTHQSSSFVLIMGCLLQWPMEALHHPIRVQTPTPLPLHCPPVPPSVLSVVCPRFFTHPSLARKW